MKVCVVQSCKNDISKRPELCFFNIPKDSYLREEWLEALGVTRRDHIQNMVVCELHFKEKDFRTGKKKTLKAHAIPCLKLGAGKADPISSDEDFIPYGSGSDPEIIEVKAEVHALNSPPKIKQELSEEKIKQEPTSDLEPEPSRRPSRRAALVAAKKIFNTVRNYGVNDDPQDPPAIPASTSPKPANALHPYVRPKSKKGPPVNVDLQMECCEDFLSPIQAEVLLKAQSNYNLVMKNLRELIACDVKVLQTDSNGLPVAITSAPNVTLKSLNVSGNAKMAVSKPTRLVQSTVIPMKLTRAPSLSAPVVMI